MKWYLRQYNYHMRLLKISFILCFLGVLCITGYRKFFLRKDQFIGKFYLYHVTEEIPRRSIIIWDDRDCNLVKEYRDAIFASTAVRKDFRYFTMDTITIAVTEQVELVNVDCDSTIGIIRFRNRFFKSDKRESENMNPQTYRGLVCLDDLHKDLPFSTQISPTKATSLSIN